MSEAAPTEIRGEVVVIDPQERAMVRAAPGDVVEAFGEYQKIQASLDRAMPDCMMTIQGKKFRKKSYWRAIATAFNLTVTLTSEQRTKQDDDWGWIVIYSAEASNGRRADGDGSCFASEKIDREGNIIATVHNVRAHAHTRAYNRAVSNLVGFGEVSAEEMLDGRRPASSRAASGARTITEPQRKRLYAKGHAAAERLGVPDEQIDEWAKKRIGDLGFKSSKDLTKEPYENICELLDNMTLDDLVPPSDMVVPPDDGEMF